MINWKVRMKSWTFWVGLAGVVLGPILAYNGLEYSDLVTWDGLGGLLLSFVQNPFLLGTVLVEVLGFVGVLSDPSTPGVKDSPITMMKEEPLSLDMEEAVEALSVEDLMDTAERCRKH